MTLFTRGTVGDLFNHPSNIPTDNPLLALDLSALLRSNDEVLERLIPIIVMDFFVSVAINRPTGRRAHLVLDEAHALLHSEAGARTMQTIFRIGRSLQFKATVITQILDDLDGSDQTRVLLENAKTKLILGPEPGLECNHTRSQPAWPERARGSLSRDLPDGQRRGFNGAAAGRWRAHAADDPDVAGDNSRDCDRSITR